jgi:hypothetical protein
MISARNTIIAAVAVSSFASAQALGGGKVSGAVDGIHNVIDGAGNVLSGAVNHLDNKATQFVDSAGNVYTVLKDAAGNATNLVMNAAGVIFDVSKLAGSFIVDALLEYPGAVVDSARKSQEELRAGLGAMGTMAGAMADAAYMPQLPPLKQMLHPGAWIDAGHANWDKSHEAMSGISAAFSAPYNAFEEKHCTPATLVPSVKKPTKITMPGFEMIIKTGSCTVVNDEVLANCLFDHENCQKDQLQIDCTKPSLEYEHTKGKIVYKHHTATKFKSKECKVEKKHGEPSELVLYEFSNHNVDLKDVANQVSSTFGNAVGALTSSATNLVSDMGSFIGGMKHEKADFEEFVAKYDGQ